MRQFRKGQILKVLEDPFGMNLVGRHAKVLGGTGHSQYADTFYVRVEIDNIKGDWLFEPWEVELVNEHKEFTDEEYESLLV